MQNIFNPLLGLAVFALSAVDGSPAGAYYVDPVNGRNANSGTKEAPWQTIYYATRTHGYLQPGDTVYLRTGLYQGTTNIIDLGAGLGNSGTQAEPITIAAYPGETPVVSVTNYGYGCIILNRKSWWVFDAVTYSNVYKSAELTSVTNLLLKNCTFGPSAASYSYSNVGFIGDSQFNIVSNCYFTSFGGVTTNCQMSGVSISIGNETYDNPMYYNLVISNRFVSGGHDHFQLNSAYNIIRGNTFVNAPWIQTNQTCYQLSRGGWPNEPNPYRAFGSRNSKPGDSGMYKMDMRNVWEHNRFLYTGPPASHAGCDNLEIGTAYSIYRFNEFAFALRGGINFLEVSPTSWASSNTVYGNTVFGNGLAMLYGGYLLQDAAGGIVSENQNGRARNNWVVNNIVWANLRTNIDALTWRQQIVRTNWNQDVSGSSYPQFVSTNGWGYSYDPDSLPDFHLLGNSPCIDAGTWLAYVTSESGSGTSFRVDNSLYFSDGNKVVAGDTIQLQGQTNRAVILTNDWSSNVITFTPALSWSNGQGVALAYNGDAPDMGAYEAPFTRPASPRNLEVITNRFGP